MKILIASGIFAPEVGGPATYAPALATELSKRGHAVSVLTYSAQTHYDSDASYPFAITRIPRRGKLVDRIRFLRAAFKAVRGCDIVYSLDWFAAGFPLVIAAELSGVPYIVRVGGDYLWEQRYLESGQEPVTLREFYERGLHRRVAYQPFYWMIRFVLSGARSVVFNSDQQRKLYEKYYGLKRITTMNNPVPNTDALQRSTISSEFVFWGRFIEMKNITTFIRAFAVAKIPNEFTLVLIGDGPQKNNLEKLIDELGITGRVRFEKSMRHAAVLERVKNCRAFVLPSWTDISPNQVYEALAIGLPALVTRENYLDIGHELPETFDPHSISELTSKLELLADDEKYREFAERCAAIKVGRTWGDVAKRHEELFKQTLGQNEFRVLQIGADRSKRGILYPDTPAFERQRAYAERFGKLDIIGFSRASDGTKVYSDEHLHIVPTNSNSPLSYGLDAIRIARGLPKPSVVSAQDPFETGLTAWWIARRLRIPLHVQVHTDFLSPGYIRRPRDRVRRLIAHFVLRRAARVRVVSERIKDSLQESFHLNTPIMVLPIFVDLEKVRRVNPAHEVTERFSKFKTKLLVVARLEPEKNIGLALEAFAKAAPKDACLIVVGDGSERSKLEILAQRSGIADRVFLEGERSSLEYYPLADLVLVPSRYEGYGLVIVEALAAGKPVLSTDVGVARETGAIVTSPQDFAASLKAWLENGPRTGELRAYPYKDFASYVQAYCDDIRV